MSKIQWTSSSIQNFFQTSMNTKSSPFDNLYQSLGDAALIKHGSYSKLMKAYFAQENKKTEDTQKEQAQSATYTSDGKKNMTTSSVLDELI